MEKKHNIELVLLEIPITYDNIDEFVPALWETHTPKLVIHVGFSELAQCFTLESQAHRKGYKRLDYFDKTPPNFTCPAEGAMRIQTRLNIDHICEEFNNLSAEENVSASKSYDAGRSYGKWLEVTSMENIDRGLHQQKKIPSHVLNP
ncbi:Pyroglutamyl-peptidase 1 [Eumeta japonica]|uniref:Pyroglutamyl-peptidase 1 n=1 Tax=Eumeta variegata TaxID=151549 RepID=A0A4C1U8F9_EUMVA|nr:Pyroglutamyl-peptidase 1 [Eumeta japonica]